MFERSQSFDIQNKSCDEIQQIIENLLEKNFSFSTKTKRLGSSLLRINYFDLNNEQEQQKDNRITILKESDNRVYIQIKGKITDVQVGQIWRDFRNKLNDSAYLITPEKPKHTKEQIVQEIKNLIEKKGYFVKNEEVNTFLDHFIEKFDRLPETNEFQSIVKGYMMMINESQLSEKIESLSIRNEKTLESLESVLEVIEERESLAINDDRITTVENVLGRRRCPSCGDESSIHEITDKTIILMDYPRIYGKKKYCGKCGFEWK
ncbi:MAG: hypothetical protein ACFE9Z_10230 [Promethearchaeota archaeon]